MVWPPASTPPASRTFEAAPSRIAPKAGVVVGDRRDRQREQHATAHREDVAQRVRGGDLAVRSRVVDERREEVGPVADHREAGRHEVDRGVIGRMEAGDEAGQAVGEAPSPFDSIAPESSNPRPARASDSTSTPSFAAQPPHSVSFGEADRREPEVDHRSIIVGQPRPTRDRAASHPGRPGAQSIDGSDQGRGGDTR